MLTNTLTQFQPEKEQQHILDYAHIPEYVTNFLHTDLGIYFRKLGTMDISHKLLDSVLIIPNDRVPNFNFTLPRPDFCYDKLEESFPFLFNESPMVSTVYELNVLKTK